MSDYNKQYSVEENLFGAPYEEFELFIQQHAVAGGKALDMSCGQGRDALMLGENGYTAVDTEFHVVEENLDYKAGAKEDYHE